MIATKWSDIDDSTLQALCDDGAAESPTLDFKRTAPDARNEAARNEFLKDVCAFANSSGGDLVYGIETHEDVAVAPAPLFGETADQLWRRLTDMLNDYIEPRISGITCKTISFGDDGYAFIVRVPPSFNGPHRYRVRGANGVPLHYCFVTRAGTKTADMDYTQIRNAFDRTSTLAERAQQFRHERIERLKVGATPRPMQNGPKSVLHFIPLAGLAKSLIDVAALYHSPMAFAMPGNFNPERQTNLDGVLMTGPREADGTVRWYFQVFRSGAMEFVRSAWSDVAEEDGGGRFIPAVRVSRDLRYLCGLALDRARDLAISGPAIMGAACLESARHPFRIARNGGDYGNTAADRDHLVIPEQWIEEISTATSVDDVARPLLDAFWQCFGEVDCDLYARDTGRWNFAE